MTSQLHAEAARLASQLRANADAHRESAGSERRRAANMIERLLAATQPAPVEPAEAVRRAGEKFPPLVRADYLCTDQAFAELEDVRRWKAIGYAEALVDHGRAPRTGDVVVSTAEELDALPVGTAVADLRGIIWQKRDDEHWWTSTHGETCRESRMAFLRGATVITPPTTAAA